MKRRSRKRKSYLNVSDVLLAIVLPTDIASDMAILAATAFPEELIDGALDASTLLTIQRKARDFCSLVCRVAPNTATESLEELFTIDSSLGQAFAGIYNRLSKFAHLRRQLCH